MWLDVWLSEISPIKDPAALYAITIINNNMTPVEMHLRQDTETDIVRCMQPRFQSHNLSRLAWRKKLSTKHLGRHVSTFAGVTFTNEELLECLNLGQRQLRQSSPPATSFSEK